ncbi:TlpA family protein disulfide reductase [Candidatus Poribacteria bacterium]|nr:TlpA family protein disulfide reductase [Candidatus Poribacteria bacterium]
MYWRPFCLFSLSLCLLLFSGCSDDTTEKMTDAGNVDKDSSFRLAPSFTLLNTELEEVSLSDYQGKVVMVDFWATWCKPCKEEIPRFIELYDEYQAQGFEMIGISTDDVEVRLKAIEVFFQELSKEGFDINYPILLADSDTIQSYQVPVLPSAYLINRNGEIVKVFSGAQESKAIYESELKKWL